MNEFDISGKTMVITGATSGIGRGLVNNAGMGNPIPAIDVTVEDWDTMMDLNLRVAFLREFSRSAAGG